MNASNEESDPQDASKLPHSPAAEISVLGSMLRDNDVIDEVLLILPTATAFYADANQKIFRAIVDLHEGSHVADAATVADLLHSRKQIEDMGGYGLLGEMLDAAPTGANAIYYAEIVRDKALTRNLIHAANEILRDAYAQTGPADDLLASAEKSILSLAENALQGTVRPMTEIVGEVADAIDRRAAEGVSPGIPSGFSNLDEVLDGFRDGELILLGARPAVGKTSIAGAMVLDIAARQKIAALFISLEMNRLELGERWFSNYGGVEGWLLRKAWLMNPQQWAAVSDAKEKLALSNLFVDDCPEQTISRIGAIARRMRRRHGIRLMVVDYLQLVHSEDRRIPREQQVATISRRLKILARTLNIPVLVLCQLNRQSEEGSDKKPKLHQLRESGSLEQDADAVLLLHRPNESSDLLEVIVAKNRNGRTGEVSLTFDRSSLRFREFNGLTPFSGGSDGEAS